MIKNPPANAGGHRLDPSTRKIPHAAEQLSPCATTTEAPTSRARAQQQEKHRNEKPTHRNEE